MIHTTANLDVDNIFTGANQFTQSLSLVESICLSGAAGKTVLCADSTSHRLKFNSGGTGSMFAVGIAAAGISAHCPQFASNGIDLVDSGGACGGGGGGGIGGSGTLNTVMLWTPDGATAGNSILTQPNTATINLTGHFFQFTENSTTTAQINTSVGAAGATGQQIIVTTACGTSSCGAATFRSASALNSGVNAANASLLAGSSSGSGTGAGGTAQVFGGQAFGSGSGGEAFISGGSSASGRQGGVTLGIGSGGSQMLFEKSLSQQGNLGIVSQYLPVGNSQANFQVADGAPAYTCNAPTLYMRGNTSDINAFLYVCRSGTSFTPITISGGGGAVSSVFGRTGAVTATSGDYTAALVTNAVSTAAANTGAASMTLNMAASTSTSSFRLPNIAAAATTTAGSIVYDTTNKNFHAGANGVDNLVGIFPTAVSPANNDCVKFSVISGVVTLNTAGAACGGSGIGGSGLATFIPVFTGPTTLSNSLIVDDGTTLSYSGTGGISLASSNAGFTGLGQGVAQPIAPNAVGLTAPVSVTGYNLIFPGVAGNGYQKWTNSTNLVTGAFHAVVDPIGTNLDLTAQSGSLGAQTLVASAPVAGRYAIDYYISESAGCATPGPGAMTATFSWTDATTGRTLVSGSLAFTASPGTGDTIRGSIPLWAASGSAITAITTYTACTTGTATYDIHAWVTEAQ